MTLYGNLSRVGDVDLEDLVGRPHGLRLYDGEVTDAELRYVQEFTELRGLGLPGTKITDTGLENLQGLSHLRYLSLYRTNVTDAGLEHLRELRQLRYLSLTGTKVTDAGVKRLRQALANCQIDHEYDDRRHTSHLRWFQYSLRPLFVVMFQACILGTRGHSEKRRDKPAWRSG